MSTEAWILLWLCCAGLGALIAKSKNRHWTEGALLGGLLGVLGVIIELFMRTLIPGSPPQGWYPDPKGSGRQRFWNGREWSDMPSRVADSRTPNALDRGAVKAQTKECPDCAESILAAAKVCKHCGYRFADTMSPGNPLKESGPRKKTETTTPIGKSSKVVCHKCQHVQAVLQSETTFTCEECGARLKRRITRG